MIVFHALASHAAQRGPLREEEVPTFQLRGRVLSVGGRTPTKETFTFRLDVSGAAVSSAGVQWSNWLKYDRPQVEATLKGYPAIYMREFPVVVKLEVGGAGDSTQVEAELRLDGTGGIRNLYGDLFGPTLGILLWRDIDRKPHAATMADYNRRFYWDLLQGMRLSEAQRPKKFPIVDRFIGGDDDRRDWREGIEHLARAGFNALMLPPSPYLRELLLEAGLRRTAWAVYAPPGGYHDFDPKATPEAIQAWAHEQAKPYLDAGYSPTDMALFTMSDEPGWYYPEALRSLASNSKALARFRNYLEVQNLTPSDFGAKNWEEVTPIGRSFALSSSGRARIELRRLFYWTMRFFAWDSAEYYAQCTGQLEKAFYPDLPVFTNWNFFSGRFYQPGPFGNNPNKESPDAAMGGQDWFEFGRSRGGTMLWTEDWFPDNQAYQWSFYCAKLRCAARRSGVQFGGYVIPRAAGDRKHGILQKVLCIVGSGGKAIEYFVFGPEYNFPTNCYSERVQVLREMAEAHRMIGAAEDLLWPGKRQQPQVGILAPRSAELWDAMGAPLPTQIVDATNTDLNAHTVDYMAEVFDLYLALQHADIPVDFVDEDDLSPDGLEPYRVLYATEPNIPMEGQQGIARWVRAGGTLVTVAGAGRKDRYNEPCHLLSELAGIVEQPRERLLVPNLVTLESVGEVRTAKGKLTAVDARARVVRASGRVEARFEDGAPAIVWSQAGKGQVVHFAWMPGMSYARSASGSRDRLPVGYSEALRRWIVYPTALAKVEPPVAVDRAMVETPMLVSSEGAVVTLLNWTGEPLQRVTLSFRDLPFSIRKIDSVERGPLVFQNSHGRVVCSLRLGAADILELRP